MDTTPTDMDLVRSVLQGQQQQFAVLVQRYQGMVFSLAFRMVGSREDAEELAQSAFVKAYQHLAGFRGDSKFSTWLYTITSSVCLSFLRKRKLDTYSLDQERVFSAAEAQAGDYSANQVEGKSRKQLLQQAMARLSPDDARLISLFYQAEQSLEEIGQIMDLSANTAKVKLHRARQRLKTILETQFATELSDWHERT
jgi:RNA polymerase sigma-70 factor (ECF subfamily)